MGMLYPNTLFRPGDSYMSKSARVDRAALMAGLPLEDLDSLLDSLDLEEIYAARVTLHDRLDALGVLGRAVKARQRSREHLARRGKEVASAS